MGVRYTFHLSMWTEQSRTKLLVEVVKSATGCSLCSVSGVCQSELNPEEVKCENNTPAGRLSLTEIHLMYVPMYDSNTKYMNVSMQRHRNTVDWPLYFLFSDKQFRGERRPHTQIITLWSHSTHDEHTQRKTWWWHKIGGTHLVPVAFETNSSW